MTTGVRATGLESFIVNTFSFLGAEISFDAFQMLGMEELERIG